MKYDISLREAGRSPLKGLNPMTNRLIFHIDVNSAYLSWSAVEQLKQGAETDLRNIPSIVGGDIASRHGVVLAKSIPAKSYGVKTGEPVTHALNKCPSLVSVKPDHKLYARYSQALMELLSTYCPSIEQVSVDECYMDFTHRQADYASFLKAAATIKDAVYDAFGFTVNIGISCNKLLAKMASDFQKPNKIHTLFPHEIPQKMWPLPVDKLYMVGRSSAEALHKLEIHTIGDLAQTDQNILISHMKSHGKLIWEYANGIDDTPVVTQEGESKCIGNSTTLPKDALTALEAKQVLQALCDQVAGRLKKQGQLAGMVSTELKYATFIKASHQRQLPSATCSSRELYTMACRLFDEMWDGTPIRLLGVRTSKLTQEAQPVQMNLFDLPRTQKELKADRAMESLQKRFGADVIKKGW